MKEEGTQTDWKYPRNANTQYYPREFSDKEKEAIQNSKNLPNFVNDVTPRFKAALQQNEIMDVFFIDWLHLGDGDASFGSKADNHLKVSQAHHSHFFCSPDPCDLLPLLSFINVSYLNLLLKKH